MILIKRWHFVSIIILIVFFESLKFVFAWAGPTVAPPNGNVDAPINVGTVDQVKNSGLGLNSLAVFGTAILSGVNNYFNFGTTAGSGGYGFRDNNGVMQFRNNAGTWAAFATSTASSPATPSLVVTTFPTIQADAAYSNVTQTLLSATTSACYLTHTRPDNPGSACTIYSNGTNWILSASNYSLGGRISCEAACVRIQ
jgi:hypothetical protein